MAGTVYSWSSSKVDLLTVYSVILLLSVTATSGNMGTMKVNLTVVIDGYTVDSTITSSDTLQLGRTALLVCRVSGIPHRQHTTYQWTCPNQPCLQAGYAGRKISNNIIAINTTSTSDGGTYTCTVTAGGMEGRQDFTITIDGGEVVHSYGRLIPHEGLISTASQLQPPDTASGDGRIQCTVSNRTADFSYTGNDVLNGTTATYTIPAGNLSNFQNKEGVCGSIHHHLFISPSTVPAPFLQGNNVGVNKITVNLREKELMNISRVIVGYDRLDLGLPMVGQYRNNLQNSTATFTALVSGARYRITAWGLGNATELSRSGGPAQVEQRTFSSVLAPPRALTITRDFEDGIELNWLPPRVTNGDIQRYIIRYTLQNGTEQEITTTDNTNYYNLTGLERGQTYYSFTVKAVNLAHTSAQSDPIGSYSHNPDSLSTPTTKSATSTAVAPTTTPISPTAASLSTPTTKSATSMAAAPTTTPITATTAISTTALTTSASPPSISAATHSNTLPIAAGAGAAGGLLLIIIVTIIILIIVFAMRKKRRDKHSPKQPPALSYYAAVTRSQPVPSYYGVAYGHGMTQRPQSAMYEDIDQLNGTPANGNKEVISQEYAVLNMRGETPEVIPNNGAVGIAARYEVSEHFSNNSSLSFQPRDQKQPKSVLYTAPNAIKRSPSEKPPSPTAYYNLSSGATASLDLEKEAPKRFAGQVNGDLYALPDKTKKNSPKKVSLTGEEYQNTHNNPNQGSSGAELLYTAVDKTLKKNTKTSNS